MLVDGGKILQILQEIRENHKGCSDAELAEHLARGMENHPTCVDLYGVSKPGRFSYSTVGYIIMTPLGERYKMGRIEVSDSEGGFYPVHEGSYCLPWESAHQFEEFIDSMETDLPIHIGIGSVAWCEEECAKALGFESVEEMRNLRNQKKEENEG
jgi:hypothetical protein